MTSLEIKLEHRKRWIAAKLESFHGQRMRLDLDFMLTMILRHEWFATITIHWLLDVNKDSA